VSSARSEIAKRPVDSVPPVDAAKILAFAVDDCQSSVIKQALLVRAVETTLLDFFGEGKLHGTIHTCVGQEFTGIFAGAEATRHDFVTSNHRCHGHFIGVTGNWRGLIDEIVGNSDGVCAGIGSSQHLYSCNFISNGQQGGLLPVAAGIALDRKRRGDGAVVVSFIGEGTLGEGVAYETMNIAALWQLPQLFVCENNFYSQSTPQEISIAGEIAPRAAAFDITVIEANTWDPAGLRAQFNEAFRYVRTRSRPMFLIVKTYRLNPHSKGDDQRDPEEIERFRERDPLTIILKEHNTYRQLYDGLITEVREYAEQALSKPKLSAESYFTDQLLRTENRVWTRCEEPGHDRRVNQQLNEFYGQFLRADALAFFIGEDVADPYGGAFKVSKHLQTEFPDRVITSPISEAALTGIGVGLALSGNRPIIEIMFGDFMTLAFDQIVNNASKVFHMYNRNISCPIVVRAPMGGRRGYGPTHSQSLERFLIGIDNCTVLSINSLVDVHRQLCQLKSLPGPAVVLENKVDYTLRLFRPPPGFRIEIGDAEFPVVTVKPQNSLASVTIVSYGGMARVIADNLIEIFEMADLLPELVAPTMIHPFDLSAICASAARTRRLAVIEEGSGVGSVGAEVLAQATERLGPLLRVLRISGYPVPVPSVPELENATLPNIDRICRELRALQEA
jgi:2-oxoisovalerate dehydrogenase E1 component